jgi:hypothetical protein
MSVHFRIPKRRGRLFQSIAKNIANIVSLGHLPKKESSSTNPKRLSGGHFLMSSIRPPASCFLRAR